MLKELVIELIVKDIKESVNYFKKYFDFSIEMAVPNNDDYTWVQISNQNIKIMMQDFNETKLEMKTFPNSLSSSNFIVLKYDSIDIVNEIYKLLMSDNINFFMDIRKTDYGTVEFGVFDPNNNMILISAESE